MSTLEVLQNARSLIADPANWWPNEDETPGKRHCMVTALWEFRNGGDEEWKRARELLHAQTDGPFLDAWNDTHSHEEVLGAFDAAIVAA